MSQAEEINTQSEELTRILNSGLKDLLVLAEDPENFKTIYSVALQVIRSLEDSGIIGDQTLLMLACEALKKHDKTKIVGLSMLDFEWDHPSIPPWEKRKR